MNQLRITLFALMLTLVLPDSFSAQTTQQQSAPDNTKVNKQDGGNAHPTADQQGTSRTDLDITNRIRKMLTAERNLSIYGKNVKVITQNGNVTLRGPVRSAGEKKFVETTAAKVAGANNVKSEIEVTVSTTERTEK